MQLTEREVILLESFRAIEKFNEIAGAGHNYQTVLNKLNIVLEEVYESLDSIVDEDSIKPTLKLRTTEDGKELIDKNGLLDGVCDILYTVFALPRELEALGYDMFGAFETVCENNSTKFVKTASEAEMSVRHYQSKGIECKSIYNEKYNCYSIVDGNNKVRKPIDYKSVELEQFLPKEN